MRLTTVALCTSGLSPKKNEILKTCSGVHVLAMNTVQLILRLPSIGRHVGLLHRFVHVHPLAALCHHVSILHGGGGVECYGYLPYLSRFLIRDIDNILASKIEPQILIPRGVPLVMGIRSRLQISQASPIARAQALC